jgi:hypothetical protein
MLDVYITIVYYVKTLRRTLIGKDAFENHMRTKLENWKGTTGYPEYRRGRENIGVHDHYSMVNEFSFECPEKIGHNETFHLTFH